METPLTRKCPVGVKADRAANTGKVVPMSTVIQSTITRAAIYCRVSTTMQEEEGSSLDTQEERCRAYAAEHGWQVVRVYRETHTGSELWERPQLTALREMVRSGAVDVMLAYALDRLSRKQTHVAIIADDCERAGAQLAFVTEDFEQSSVGTFLRSAKAFAAELEREKIKERTKRGMMARIQSGKFKPGPCPLYGYQWADEGHSRYVIDEEKAAVIRRMYQMVVDGRSLREVERQLNADGIPTPSGRAPRWTYANIPAMLANQSYMGVAIQNRHTRQRVNGKIVNSIRPVEEHVHFESGTIPPIVSPDVFASVQARLARNKQEAVRNHRDPESFLLRGGFIRCGACGGVARSRSELNPNGTRRARYAINDRSTHHDCPKCAIATHVIDNAVWEKVRALVMRPEIVMQEVERVKTDDPTTADRAAVESLLTETRRKRDNLTRALANIDDADVQTSVLSELKVVSQRVRDLETERDMLTAQRGDWQVSRDQLDSLSAWLGVVSTNIDALTYQQKRDLLTALDVRVLLYPTNHTPRYTITASLPLCSTDPPPLVYESSGRPRRRRSPLGQAIPARSSPFPSRRARQRPSPLRRRPDTCPRSRRTRHSSSPAR